MSQRPTRLPGELAFYVVLLIFSLAALFQAFRISGFGGLSTPGMFPMLAAGMMVVSLAIVIVRSLRTSRAGAGFGETAGRFLREVMPPRHVAVIGMIAGYLVLLPLLGFLVSSALFLFASFQFLWRRSPAVSLALTAASLATVYVVFRIVFQVVLPQGMLLRGIV